MAPPQRLARGVLDVAPHSVSALVLEAAQP
jgi:hypothetical protein